MFHIIILYDTGNIHLIAQTSINFNVPLCDKINLKKRVVVEHN